MRIGIVAVSVEGAVLCYRAIATEGRTKCGEPVHPEITMHTLPLSVYMRCIAAGIWDGVASLLLQSANVPSRAGADEVAAVAVAKRFRGVGIVGTRYLIESQVYPVAPAKYGIMDAIPDQRGRERCRSARRPT